MEPKSKGSKEFRASVAAQDCHFLEGWADRAKGRSEGSQLPAPPGLISCLAFHLVVPHLLCLLVSSLSFICGKERNPQQMENSPIKNYIADTNMIVFAKLF